MIASGWPEGLKADGEMMPPDVVEDSAIDDYLISLERLRDYESAYIDAFIFGPVPTAKFRRFALIHAADHLRRRLMIPSWCNWLPLAQVVAAVAKSLRQ